MTGLGCLSRIRLPAVFEVRVELFRPVCSHFFVASRIWMHAVRQILRGVDDAVNVSVNHMLILVILRDLLDQFIIQSDILVCIRGTSAPHHVAEVGNRRQEDRAACGHLFPQIIEQLMKALLGTVQMAVVDIIGADLEQDDIRRIFRDIIAALHRFQNAVELSHPPAGQICDRIAAVTGMVVIVGDLLTLVGECGAVLAFRADKINVVVALVYQHPPEEFPVTAFVLHTVGDGITERHDFDGTAVRCQSAEPAARQCGHRQCDC